MTTVTILAWLSIVALAGLVVADHVAEANGDDLRERLRHRAGRPPTPTPVDRLDDRPLTVAPLAANGADREAWPARFAETLVGPRLRLQADDGRRITLRLYHPDGVDRLARAGQLFVTSLRWRPSTGWEARVDSLGGSAICWAWFAAVDEPAVA